MGQTLGLTSCRADNSKHNVAAEVSDSSVNVNMLGIVYLFVCLFLSHDDFRHFAYFGPNWFLGCDRDLGPTFC